MITIIMKKPFFIIGILGVIIILLSVVQVVVSNSISTTGMVLGEMQTEIESYRKENTLLSEKILTLSSFDHVASVAAQLGYVPAGTPIAVTASLPLAINR